MPSSQPDPERRRDDGDGWTILDANAYAQRPGVHDITAELGITTATRVLLVILRAAEQWGVAPALTDRTAFVHRQGRVLLTLSDGATQVLDGDDQLWADPRPVRTLVNSGSTLAQVLVIAPFAAD